MDLFNSNNEFKEQTYPDQYQIVSDPSDRKFVALANATSAILITNDDDLLSIRLDIGVNIMSAEEFNMIIAAL